MNKEIKLANIALQILHDYRTVSELYIKETSEFPELDLESLETWYEEKRKEIYKIVGWDYPHD